MVVKIVLLAMLIGVVMLLLYDSIPSNNEYAICAIQMNSNYSNVYRTLSDRNYSQIGKCKLTREQILNDMRCVESVKTNRITGWAVLWMSEYRAKINSVLRRHNQYCQGYEVPIYEIDIVNQ